MRGLGQAEDAGPKYPEGQDHGLRDRVSGPVGVIRPGSMALRVATHRYAAARVDHGDERTTVGENHDHALDGVREHHGPGSRPGGVQDDREPEQRHPTM